jgi:hypothetical protein
VLVLLCFKVLSWMCWSSHCTMSPWVPYLWRPLLLKQSPRQPWQLFGGFGLPYMGHRTPCISCPRKQCHDHQDQRPAEGMPDSHSVYSNFLWFILL